MDEKIYNFLFLWNIQLLMQRGSMRNVEQKTWTSQFLFAIGQVILIVTGWDRDWSSGSLLGVILGWDLWKVKEKLDWEKKRLACLKGLGWALGQLLSELFPESFLGMGEGTIVPGRRSDLDVTVFCIWGSPFKPMITESCLLVSFPTAGEMSSWPLKGHLCDTSTVNYTSLII